MRALLPESVAGFIGRLGQTYEVRVPVDLPDGTRALGSMGDGPVSLFGGPLPQKPTVAFFPHHQEVFTATGKDVQTPPERRLPLLVAGLTPRDLACLQFIDRFFADGWRDDIYFRQRDEAVVIGVAGWCGPEGSFLPLAGGGCDLELAWDGDRWLIVPHTEMGRVIGEGAPDTAADDALDELRRLGESVVDGREDVIRRASELLREGKIPDAFWSEIGDRCIACTGCNLACPTCTCFGVQDWRYAAKVVRSRMWDSCQLDGFMREASGHNPLGTEGLRTRRRIHHKLAADRSRWGEISCFLCGRCDAVCPTGIGIVAVAREMVDRYGSPGPA